MITINNAKDAVKAAKTYFSHPEQEECIIICLKRNNEVKDIHFMALGSDCAVTFPLKNICKQAVLDLAAGVILMHSHPSGCTEPSSADLKMTEKMKAALELFDISLLDHIIVAGDKARSFADESVFKI